jgi:hypothetical protein
VNDTGDLRDWTEPDDDLTPPPEPPPPRRRRLRPLLWLLEAAGAVVGAILLALVLIAIRLEFGPIDVDFLTPALVDYLNAKADPLTVQIERTSLSWTAGASTIEVIGSGLRVADPSGRDIVSIPKLSLSVSLRALGSGRFALSRVAVQGPRLRLIRARSGEVGIDLGADTPGSAVEPALAATPLPLQEMWDDFSGRPSADRSLGYLDRISIAEADITLDDRQAGLLWHVGRGRTNFVRRADGLEAETSASLGLGQGETRLFGHLGYSNSGQRLKFALGWDSFDPSLLGPALPAPYDATATRLRLPVAGRAEGEIGLGDMALGPLHLRLDAGAGALADPYFAGGRLELARVILEAEYAPADHRVKLVQLLLDLGGPSIDLAGTVEGIPADPLALLGPARTPPLSASTTIDLRAMPLDRLAGFWPPGLASHTRSWITTNLSAGTIEELHAAVALALDPGADKPIQGTGFSAAMTVKGASVDFLHGLPRVEGVDASLTLQPKRLDFEIGSGHLKGLVISRGTVVMDDLDAPYERCTIDLALAGPAQDVMTVLDTKPLQYSRALGIDPRQVGGTVDGTLHFRLPLRNNLPVSEIDYGATAQLSGLAIGHAALGRDLSDGNFALKLAKNAITLDGTAKLDGLAATMSWTQRLAGTAGPRGEAHVKTIFDDAARKRFDLDLLPDNVRGPVGTDLVYSEFDDHRARAAVALDLAAATMSVEDFGWRKPAGQAARAEFAVDFADGHPTRLSDLVLRGPRLEIRGELGFAPDGRLVEARAPKFRLGETDVALTLAHTGIPWQIGLRGPVVDLSEPLKRFKDKPDQPHEDSGPTVELDVRSEQVVLGPDRVVRNAQLTATMADHGLARARLSAGIDRAGKLDFELDPIEAGGAFTLTTDDFGGLLRVVNVSDDIVGGKLTISGHAAREAKGRRFSGRAEGADYRVNGAPFMVRLMSIASLDSIQTLLSGGGGIAFTTLKSDVTLYDGKLGLSHARAYGGALAVNVDQGRFDLGAGTVDLDGTLVPAYSLNSALGNVPILGDLLMGGEGEGLFAANFRMSGAIDHPAISVNPLSPLAPGFLRRVFLFDAPEPSKGDQGK